jgi:deoxycytidine triphosphate deaminase
MMNNPPDMAGSRFAQSDEEAKERFEALRSSDPFPSIPPALLNSADISDYVAATGMLYPFEDSDEQLKSASYRVNLLGKCIYWDDENGEKKVIQLDKGKEFKLKPNSIVFITPEPTFRLPDYIAVRFNLEIKHIHKGILLGTGPLVDPGFVGKLLVPLHNLTANEYIFRGGDPIIWIEFTKLSPNDKWDRTLEIKERQGVFRGFPANKSGLDVEFYLEKAVGRDRSIISSIPGAIAESKKRAIQAERYAGKASKEVRRFRNTIDRRVYELRNFVTVAVIIGVLAVAIPLLVLIFETNTYVNNASKEVPALLLRVKTLEDEVQKLQQKTPASSRQDSPDSVANRNANQQVDSREATPKNVVPGNANTNH